MGIDTVYFAAPSDEAAGAVIERAGGPRVLPGLPAVVQPEPPRRRWFGLRRPEPADPPRRNDGPSYPTVEARFIDPLVMTGTLEELLTGRAYDAIEADADDRIVASVDDGVLLVVRLSETICDALADAVPERLRDVAGPWSETEEFWGDADPDDLCEWFLQPMADLARQARTEGHQLYCWVSV